MWCLLYAPVGEIIPVHYIELVYCSPILHWDIVWSSWHALPGEDVWASAACGTWHGVSGSGSGHGLWLLDLSLGVHGCDDEVAWAG